jgi:hypothetical protein
MSTLLRELRLIQYEQPSSVASSHLLAQHRMELLTKGTQHRIRTHLTSKRWLPWDLFAPTGIGDTLPYTCKKLWTNIHF